MKKEFSYLKYVLFIVNLALGFQVFTFLVGLGLTIAFSIWGVDQVMNGFISWAESFGGTVEGVPEFPSLLGAWVGVWEFLPLISLFVFVRKFIKNLMADKIFVAENAKFARYASYSLFAASFLSTADGFFGVNNFYFLDGTYLIGAVLLFTISKILERAIAIADENEFTI